jgi:hypothetical protein
MSTSNSENNNALSGGAQGSNNHDATQIVFSWLPHSKALGASSTVAIRVRNASLTDAGLSNGTSSMYPSPAVVNDEKKYNEEDASTRNTNNLLLYAPQCRVEASIYGYGLPLQAAPISTKYSSLLPYNHNNNSHHVIKKNGVLPSSYQHLDFMCGKDWSTVTFDTMVSLPVRWRDLTRDACLTLNVFCDGHVSSHDDAHDSNSNGNSDQKAWGTTLPLFDEHGRLRSGLYKLKLHPNMLADGGMGYQSMGETNEDNIETFLEGGATPGILKSQDNNNKNNTYHSKWLDERKLDKNQEDPKWKASLILHDLDRLETSTSSNNAVAGTNLGIGKQSTASSVPWLDALTK